jgi:sec-independent protein translocase protein TatA
MLGLGPYELLAVGVIALLFFGNRVPEMMRSLGRGVNEFKRGLRSVEDEIREVEDHVDGVKTLAKTD